MPVYGNFVEYTVDQVILAISQLPDLDFLVKDEQFDLTKWSTLAADRDTMETGKKGVFACGDAVSGPSTVVEAMPPTIGRARRRMTSEPRPSVKKMGSRPATMTPTVISFGRPRITAPATTASRSSSRLCGGWCRICWSM